MTLPSRTCPLSPLTRLQTRTRWLPSFPCMLNYLIIRELILMQYVAPIHTVYLPSCRVIASPTKQLEVQTAVRTHVPALSLSSHTHSPGPIEFPQAKETARTPTKYIVGKDKCIISDRDNHDGNIDVQVLPTPLARYRRDGRIPK